MHKWNELTREQIGRLSKNDAMVILPIGATEQHGPHLPVETDTILINEIVEKSTIKASKDIPIVVAPTIPFGFSHHHFLYPGALSLEITTLLTVLNELLVSIMKSGFSKIFILNSHGGNDEIIRLSARELALKYSVIIGASSYWSIAKNEIAKYRKTNQLHLTPGHAGQFETSLLLAIKPNCVNPELLKNAKSDRVNLEIEVDNGKAKIENNAIWEEIDGFTDDPIKSTKEMGIDLLNIITDKVSDQFKEFYSM